MATKTEILSYLYIIFVVLIWLYNFDWRKSACELRNGVIALLLSAVIWTCIFCLAHFEESLLRSNGKSILNSLMRDVTAVAVIISLIATVFVMHNIEGSCERFPVSQRFKLVDLVGKLYTHRNVLEEDSINLEYKFDKLRSLNKAHEELPPERMLVTERTQERMLVPKRTQDKMLVERTQERMLVKVEVTEGGFRVEEEVAVLAGDALFDFAFEHILVSTVGVPPAKLSEPSESSRALLEAAVVLGAILGGGSHEEVEKDQLLRFDPKKVKWIVMFEKRLEDFAVAEELVSNLGIFFYMDEEEWLDGLGFSLNLGFGFFG
ncbi:hypothetical protein CMV_013227 [Castanea mollissima]|uniref:Uncharacterized protein n=1 Tax=Castanea mollissima TaxID=60419 RepID=A0A8J4RE48_9ROSI|nr:hypothetical protein CMV_013227 [Castanea mollissima]